MSWGREFAECGRTAGLLRTCPAAMCTDPEHCKSPILGALGLATGHRPAVRASGRLADRWCSGYNFACPSVELLCSRAIFLFSLSRSALVLCVQTRPRSLRE